MHLIQDKMWLEPRTLLWPFYGFAFEKIDLTQCTSNILYTLHTDPAVYIPELVGAIILVAFIAMLVRSRKVYAFVRNGQV